MATAKKQEAVLLPDFWEKLTLRLQSVSRDRLLKLYRRLLMRDAENKRCEFIRRIMSYISVEISRRPHPTSR